MFGIAGKQLQHELDDSEWGSVIGALWEHTLPSPVAILAQGCTVGKGWIASSSGRAGRRRLGGELRGAVVVISSTSVSVQSDRSRKVVD